MTDLPHNYLDKIINPDLARAALHHSEPHGEFKALVRVVEPEQIPQYMQHIELQTPGLFKVRIPCTKMVSVGDDDNIISIELIEHISS